MQERGPFIGDDKDAFVSFDGTRIVYEDSGEGPAVILLHGLGADGRMFGPVDQLREAFEATATTIAELGVEPMPRLPPEGRKGLIARLRQIGARVIVPDLRGHGASGKPHDPAAYTHSAIARDVAALTEHLGLDAIDVVGYSLGAVTAAKMLVLENAQVASAVLAGIGKEILDGQAMVLPANHPAARLPAPLTMRAYSEFVADALTSGEASSTSSYLTIARALGNDVEALAAAIRGDGAEQLPVAALQAVRIPVLSLNGRNDPASQAIDKLLETLPHVRAVTCEGDHLSALWQPSFHQAVIDFLAEQWRTRKPRIPADRKTSG